MHWLSGLWHRSSRLKKKKKGQLVHFLSRTMFWKGSEVFVIRASLFITSCLPVWQTGSLMIQIYLSLESFFLGSIIGCGMDIQRKTNWDLKHFISECRARHQWKGFSHRLPCKSWRQSIIHICKYSLKQSKRLFLLLKQRTWSCFIALWLDYVENRRPGDLKRRCAGVT